MFVTEDGYRNRIVLSKIQRKHFEEEGGNYGLVGTIDEYKEVGWELHIQETDG